MDATNQWQTADRQQIGTYRGVIRLFLVTTGLLALLLVVLALTLL
jgi:hypothetical protein